MYNSKATKSQLAKISLTIQRRQLFSPVWKWNEWIFKQSLKKGSKQMFSDIISMLDGTDEEIKFIIKSKGFHPNQ